MEEDNHFFLSSSPFQLHQNKRRRIEDKEEIIIGDNLYSNKLQNKTEKKRDIDRNQREKEEPTDKRREKRVKLEEKLTKGSFLSNLKSGYQSFVDPFLHLAGETSNYIGNLFNSSPSKRELDRKKKREGRNKSLKNSFKSSIEMEEKEEKEDSNQSNQSNLNLSIESPNRIGYYYPLNFIGMDSSIIYSFQNFGLEEKKEETKQSNVLDWFSRKKPLILNQNENEEEESELDQSQISFMSHLDSIESGDKSKEEKRKSLTIDLTSLTEDEEEKEKEVKKPIDEWRKFSPLRRNRKSLNQEEADQLNTIKKYEERIKSCKEDRNRKGLTDRERLERRMRKKKAGVHKFTDEEKELLEDFFTIRGRDTDVLAEKFNQKITRSDLSSLKGSSWLNDEVINFYMNILSQRNKNDPALPNCEFFNTFFYPMLADKGYDRVKKWTRKIDVFEKDKIIVPIHLGMHWCLAVVNIKEKRFEYYDSLGGSGTRGTVLKNLRKWLSAEYLDKKKQQLDLSEWSDYKNTGMVPQQQNGYDCGVFTCRFADCISQNKPFPFSQEHMQHFRKRLMVDILSTEYTIKK
eukprot:TRINITY_DN8197_c0_g1_i2.p1 TRINITY_DN8197_c0_g1~~TRINITY_DN8197_c0_g1_i2.p1  ORF type:complete len:574 (-),score=241.18 TRINITY_DN8197_c0_g1_i2:408-2129(-)